MPFPVLLLPSAVAAQRLPRTVEPVHHDITVAPDLAAATHLEHFNKEIS